MKSILVAFSAFILSICASQDLDHVLQIITGSVARNTSLILESNGWTHQDSVAFATSIKSEFSPRARQIIESNTVAFKKLNQSHRSPVAFAQKTVKELQREIRSVYEGHELEQYKQTSSLQKRAFERGVDRQAFHDFFEMSEEEIREFLKFRKNDQPLDDKPVKEHLRKHLEDNQLYKDLGVSPTATQEEIKAAFRKISRENHPDKTNGDPVKAAVFKKANEAYHVLNDPEARLKYDRTGIFGEGTDMFSKVSKSHFGHENFAEFVEKIKPYSSQPQAWDKLKADIFKHFDKNGNPISDEATLKDLLKFKEKGKTPGFIYRMRKNRQKVRQLRFLGKEQKLLQTVDFERLPVGLQELVDHRMAYIPAAAVEAVSHRPGAFLLVPALIVGAIALMSVVGLVALVGYFVSLVFKAVSGM